MNKKSLKIGKFIYELSDWDFMNKIDIHNSKDKLETSIKYLNKSSMSDKQKKKLLRLIEELQIGKAAKKKVGNHRLAAYIQNWTKLNDYFKKDFDDITEAEAEKFYRDLDSDKIRKNNGDPYKPNSKEELIKALKRYCKWSMPEIKYRKLVGWIKEYKDVPEMRAINVKEAEAVVKLLHNPRDKALFMFLFDSGCRIEEALNLHILSIEKKDKEKKEGEYYLVDIKFSKTLPRRISIPIAEPYITELLKEHPDRNNPEALLFIIGYDAARKMIKTYSNKALGFKVTPHQLRHSSASYYCKKIDNPYKFCYRYGWKFGSKEANRYIDRNLLGEEEQENLKNLIETDRVQELERQANKYDKEIEQLKDKVNKTSEISKEALYNSAKMMKLAFLLLAKKPIPAELKDAMPDDLDYDSIEEQQKKFSEELKNFKKDK